MKEAHLLKYYGMNIIPWDIIERHCSNVFMEQNGSDWSVKDYNGDMYHYNNLFRRGEDTMPISEFIRVYGREGRQQIIYNGAITISLLYYPQADSHFNKSFSWDLYPHTILNSFNDASSEKKDFLNNFEDSLSKTNITPPFGGRRGEILNDYYTSTYNHDSVEYPGIGSKITIFIRVFPEGCNLCDRAMPLTSSESTNSVNYIEVHIMHVQNKNTDVQYVFDFYDPSVVELAETLLSPYSFIKSDDEFPESQRVPLDDSAIDKQEIKNVGNCLLKLSRLIMLRLDINLKQLRLYMKKGFNLDFLSIVYFNLFLATFPLSHEGKKNQFKERSEAYELPEIVIPGEESPSTIKVSHALKYIISLEDSNLHKDGKLELTYHNTILFVQNAIELKRIDNGPSSELGKMKIPESNTINNGLPNERG